MFQYLVVHGLRIDDLSEFAEESGVTEPSQGSPPLKCFRVVHERRVNICPGMVINTGAIRMDKLMILVDFDEKLAPVALVLTPNCWIADAGTKTHSAYAVAQDADELNTLLPHDLEPPSS